MDYEKAQKKMIAGKKAEYNSDEHKEGEIFAIKLAIDMAKSMNAIASALENMAASTHSMDTK